MKKNQTYGTWIQITSVFILKQKILMQVIYKKGLEKKFGTSNYEVERPLIKQKNKQSNWINKR